MIRFSKGYFALTVLLFVTEVLIAVYMHDAIIRPYGGDFLVVILIYCFICSSLKTPMLPIAFAVLIFAYGIEVLQYFHFVYWLGLGRSNLARVVLGTSFSWTDILSYTLGILFTIGLEFIRGHRKVS